MFDGAPRRTSGGQICLRMLGTGTSPLAPSFFSVLFLWLVVFGELSGGDAISSLALLDFPSFCVFSALAGAFRYVWDYNCRVLVCLWWFAVFRFGLWVLSFWCIWPSDAGSRIGCGDLGRSYFKSFPFYFCLVFLFLLRENGGALSVILPCGSISVCLRLFNTQQIFSRAISMC